MIWSLWFPLGLFVAGVISSASQVMPTAGAFGMLIGFVWLVGSGLRSAWRRVLRRPSLPVRLATTSSAPSPTSVNEEPSARGAPVGQKRAPKPASKPVQTESLPHWEDDRERLSIVGESHYQDALRRLCADRAPGDKWTRVTAVLMPEDNNKFDAMAVAVLIEGEVVGYLARDDARAFRRRLKTRAIAGRATSCGALIRGGYVGKEGVLLAYGVDLLFNLARPTLSAT